MGNWPLTPIDSGDVNYSTTPVKTGRKWIDGKDVYRIVVTGTINGVTYISIPNAGIDTVVKYYAIAEDSNNAAFVSSAFFGGNVNNICVVGVEKNNNRVSINNSIQDLIGRSIHVVIDYTKL